MKKESELKVALGLREALAIVIGRIIGSGIFRTPGPIFIAVCGLDLSKNYQLGDIPTSQISIGLFFLAWLLGGLVTYLGALCYAELVSLLPRSGGPYAFLKKAYPEYVSFLRGWAMFFVSETASIVAVALVFSEYTSIFLEKTFDLSLGLYSQASLALVVIWLFSFSNCFGVFLSGILQDLFSYAKFIALTLMAFSFFAISPDTSHFVGNIWPSEWTLATLLGFGQAMRYSFFAYSGWEGATYVAEEVKNPRKNLPLSLFIGIGFVMFIYLLTNLGYLLQLSPEEFIVVRKQIAVFAMDNAFGIIGSIILASFVMLSTLGNVSTQILVKARTWYAMAKDNLFFPSMATLHPKHKTPNHALYGQALWASVLLFYSLSFENTYEAMIDFFSFTSTLFNFLTFLSVLILRKKMANIERSFRVPCLPLILGIVLFIQLAFLVITFYDRPIPSLLGIGLTLSGLPYYLFLSKQRQKAKSIPPR